MPPNDPLRSCVATVTDDQFVDGTAVLVHSFLRHNPWFSGSIVAFHDGLASRSLRVLESLPRVECRRVGDALRARLKALATHHPRLAAYLPRFHSLEAFGLSGFDRVVYLDSDVLCLGDATPLFELPDGFHACPDLPSLRGQGRDALSFRPVDVPPGDAGPNILAPTFNSGVMVLGRNAREAAVTGELLARIDPVRWARARTGHTDQFVLNLAFRDRWSALPTRFNLLVPPSGHDDCLDPQAMDDAVFIHFLGRPKPWQDRTEPDGSPVEGPRRVAQLRWERTRSELGTGSEP